MVVAKAPSGGSSNGRGKGGGGRSHSVFANRRTHDDAGVEIPRENTGPVRMMDDRRTWNGRNFPLIKPGPINVYHPDSSANVRYRGRQTDMMELIAAHLLTRGPSTTLVYGFMGYFGIMIVFMLLFVVGGKECANVNDFDLFTLQHMRNTYFLSCHSMSTVGYGSIFTISDYCNTVMLIQSYVNIALVAVITSALFVNFSRPKLGLQFSSEACLFNVKSTECYPEINVQVVKKSVTSMWNTSVQAVLWDYTEFPEIKRINLTLVQPSVSWVDYGIRISHIIDDDSPMSDVLKYYNRFGVMPNAFHILVTVSGMHAATGTPINTMYSYSKDNILMNRKFLNSFHGTKIEPGEQKPSIFDWGIQIYTQPYKMLYDLLYTHDTDCMEINLATVNYHDLEEEVNARERRAVVLKKFINAVKTVQLHIRLCRYTRVGQRLSTIINDMDAVTEEDSAPPPPSPPSSHLHSEEGNRESPGTSQRYAKRTGNVFVTDSPGTSQKGSACSSCANIQALVSELILTVQNPDPQPDTAMHYNDIWDVDTRSSLTICPEPPLDDTRHINTTLSENQEMDDLTLDSSGILPGDQWEDNMNICL